MTAELTDKQFETIRHGQARVNVWQGAVSSGKTIGSLVAWLLKVADAPPGGEIVVIGRTRDSVGRNVFGPLQDRDLFGPVATQVRYNHGASFATVLGRRVWVMGASDVRAEAILRGLTVGLAYVDEATLCDEAFWKMLLSRLRVPGAMLMATTNPDGPAHWFKREVVDRADELGYRVFHFVIDDNPNLPTEYVTQLKREYRGLWYRRFILGHWVQAEGAIYDMWDPDRHVVTPDRIPVMDRVLALGIDQGSTNPTRGMLVGAGAGRLWVLDEWAPPNGWADVRQSAHLRHWLSERIPATWRRPEWYFVDPAAASFKRQLWDDGVLNVANAVNDVVPGIRTVGSLLATNRLIVSTRATHLIKYLPGYVWDPKATEKGEDKPVKLDDHEVDALRYAVHSSRALWRTSVPVLAAAPGAPGTDEERQAA